MGKCVCTKQLIIMISFCLVFLLYVILGFIVITTIGGGETIGANCIYFISEHITYEVKLIK